MQEKMHIMQFWRPIRMDVAIRMQGHVIEIGKAARTGPPFLDNENEVYLRY